MNDLSPALSLESLLSGNEPVISKSSHKRLGKTQLAFLRWLSEQSGDVTMLACWEWVHYQYNGYPPPPPYRKQSKKAERQRALSRYSTHKLGGLVRSLLRRELIDVVLYEGEEYTRIRYTAEGSNHHE